MNYRIISGLILVLSVAIMIFSGYRFLEASRLRNSSAILTKTSDIKKVNQSISVATEIETNLPRANSLQPEENGLDFSSELNKNANFQKEYVSQKPRPPAKIVKTDDEWRKLLTPDQFYVLREKGTEPPFSGENTNNHQPGEYFCAACHLKLFSSKAKFDSETGWLSFYRPISINAVIEEIDNEFETVRTEILCSRCHSHIGHVFNDGPKPTGLRYCTNSIALEFKASK